MRKVITTILILFALTAIKAQDKFEYASVTWTSTDYGSKVLTSINGTDFTEEKVEVSKEQKNLFNTNPLFTKVNELQSKGWEVVTFQQHSLASDMRVAIIYTAYLKRKK